MKTAVIDVGGGMRGIYANGIFDRCQDEKLHFDLCIGVSAGSANIASFMAGQKGRNFFFYTQYAFRREYMSMKTMLKTGSYIDLDYAYGQLSSSQGEYPLDYAAMKADPAELLVVATNAVTGEPKYFDKSYVHQDDYDIFKASSCIPVVCRPYKIGGTPYFDGALSDPVPVQKALDMGCDKILLILSKPKDLIRQPGKDLKIARAIEHKYPAAARLMRQRAQLYNASVALAKELEKEGKLFILAPEDTCGVDTLTRSHEALVEFYARGYQDAAAIKPFLGIQ